MLEGLTDEQIDIIPEAPDGKAEFFSTPVEKDYIEFQREEEGMKPWYERIAKL